MKKIRIMAVSLLLLVTTVSKSQTVAPSPTPVITITSIEDAGKQLKALNAEIIATKSDAVKSTEVFTRLKKFAEVVFSKYTVKQLNASSSFCWICVWDYAYCKNICGGYPNPTPCSACDALYQSCLSHPCPPPSND